MSSPEFVTGEAVALDLRPAALPSRVVAGLVDASLQALVFLSLGVIITATSLELSDAATQALGIVLLVVTLIVYPVTFETLLRGRTPGKAAMGLRVVRDDGGPIAFRQALARGLAGAFLERPGITLFSGGVVCSLLNAKGKRIGDLLAGTVVLRERVAVRGGIVATMPPELADWAAGLDLSGLSNELALSVRQFVSRAGSLTSEARDQLGGQLVAAVGVAVGPAPAGAPGWAVLAAVLAERRRRESERLAGPAGSYAAAQRLPAAAAAPALTPAPEPPPPPGAGGFAAPH